MCKVWRSACDVKAWRTKSPPSDIKGRIACETVDIRCKTSTWKRSPAWHSRPLLHRKHPCDAPYESILPQTALFCNHPTPFIFRNRRLPPCVRLSPSAVCLLRIAFRELRIFKKRLPRSREVSLFHLLFVRRLRSFVHKVAAFPACWAFSCIFARLGTVFVGFCLPDLIIRLTPPSARLKFVSDSPANRYGTPFQKTIFRPIPKHFRHAFSNRFFRTLNSPYTGTFSKKKIQTAKVDVLNILYIARLL